jgi:histidine triad (HIT) family protein
MDSCIFCKIIAGDLPCVKVYEDDFFIAFLDLFPSGAGHTLLVPKKHIVNIFDTKEEDGGNTYSILTRLAKAIKLSTNCDGLNIIQNNGEAAGQVVFHSHIHLIPRYTSDGIKPPARKPQADLEKLKEIGEKIKGNIR